MAKANPGNMNAVAVAAVAVVAIVVFGAGYILYTSQCPECVECEVCEECVFNESMCPPCPVCEPCVNESGEPGISLIYLEPLECKDCDRSMIEELSGEIGLEVRMYVSDSVPRPSMLVSLGNRSTLITVISKFNVMSAICRLTGHEKSCQLHKKDLIGLNNCLSNYNITSDTVLFLYLKGDSHSKTMGSWIRDLEEEGHKFHWIDIENKTDMEAANKCLMKIFDLEGYFPQFICPCTAEHRTGAFEKEIRLKEFTDRCVDVASL